MWCHCFLVMRSSTSLSVFLFVCPFVHLFVAPLLHVFPTHVFL